MSTSSDEVRPIRVLAVDDEPAILDSYRKILAPEAKGSSDLDDLKAKLFGGEEKVATAQVPVETNYCRQAEEAVEAIHAGIEEGNPFALVLLDMRMPPGRDGAWAAQQIRALDKDVGIVIVTAFSDIDPRELSEGVPPPDKIFYLQKPFHPHEIRQLAAALGTKWRAERDLDRTERMNSRLGRVVENAPNEIFVLDSETLRLLQANARATKNLGYSPAELTEMSPFDLLPELSESELRRQLAPLVDGVEEHVRLSTMMRRKDGTSYPAEIKVHMSSEESPPVFVAITNDISERVSAQSRIHRLAYYDTLTDLPNRNLFIYGLERALMHARREKRRLALLFLDLDRFKRINDTLGHEIGDLLLKNVGTRLVTSIRETDLVCRGDLIAEQGNVARLGGDEFTVVLDKIDDVSDAARVAERLTGTLSRPNVLGDHEVVVTPSIGISIFPDDGDDAQTLLKNADTAMYHAKKSGRSTFQFYASEMNERALERLNLEAGLRKAVERDELILNYQPLVEAPTGKLVGVEALVRWQSSEFGLVSPGDFIPLAEDTGLITSVGRWVVEEALGQLRAWNDSGLPPVTMSVNLSSRQFQNSATLLQMIRKAVDETGIRPEDLHFELTEGTIMENVDTMVQILRDLKDLGCSLSLDDFGTGYSSLSYLKRLPLDVLKIDRSFVMDLGNNPEDAAITDAIIAMGHRLDLKIVAEGVETQEQYDLLRNQGVDVIQGFLISKPLPAPELPAFVRRTWPPSER
jgi:diguanylate cyclase (GGDEF)-like protein/PAS domain S-box-containing protein